MTGDTVGALEAEPERLSCASLVDVMGRLHGHRAHLLPLAEAVDDTAVTPDVGPHLGV